MAEKVKSIGVDELKRLQTEVLKAIDTFCRKQGITYSLGCGTLLGAIRHKGYIPWDDDIDIYLLRDDFNRLIKEFPEVYNNYFKLISLERDEKWSRPYAKAYDDRTIVVEKAKNPVTIGVGIDVYPIDDVPDNEEEWLRYNRKRRFYQRINSLMTIRMGGRSVWKDSLLVFGRLVNLFVSQRRYADFLSKLAQRYNGKGYEHVFECVQGMLQKHKFKKELFSSTIDWPFENEKFKVFKDYHGYLINAYGDYMQLPPEDKRVSHHSFKAMWK